MAFTKADLGCRSQISGRMPQAPKACPAARNRPDTGAPWRATTPFAKQPEKVCGRKASMTMKSSNAVYNGYNVYMYHVESCGHVARGYSSVIYFGVAVITILRLTTGIPDHETLETHETIELSRVTLPGNLSLKNVQDVKIHFTRLHFISADHS